MLIWIREHYPSVCECYNQGRGLPPTTPHDIFVVFVRLSRPAMYTVCRHRLGHLPQVGKDRYQLLIYRSMSSVDLEIAFLNLVSSL